MEVVSPSKLAWLAVAFAVAAAAGVVAPCAARNTAQDFVNLHNSPRADVGVASMTWNATVAAYALNYANQRAAADCSLVHSGGPYGENLFWGSAGYAWSAADAVGSWVAEKQYYNHATNTCSAPPGKSCGHYMQVVWRASTAIGCARVVCSNNAGVFIICNYSPPGNIIGQSPY
jgi:pathogenesis-related protein 1